MSRAWMPLYVADYLADTGHLSTLEHGAYMLLIMHYWQNEGLPADDKRIARVVRLPYDDWMEIKEVISELFNEGWRHKRIDAELAKTDAIISKRSAAGKAGAFVRYNNRMANANNLSKQTHGQSQSQSHKEKKDNNTEIGLQNGNGLSKKESRVYAFEHGVVRLLESDLAKWRRAYPHVSVEGELIAKEPWLAKQASWFNAAAGWLAKAEKQATARPPPERFYEKDPLGNLVEVGREIDPFGNEVHRD